MKISEINEWLPIWFESKRPIYLRGEPGCGKSETLANAPAILGKLYNKNFGIVIVNLANVVPMDLYGYGLPHHSADSNGGDSHAHMIFSLPFFWKTAEGKFLWEYDGGIIVIEEADKGDLDNQKIIADAAQLLRFGMHQLPDNWRVWFTGNRAEDRSGSTRQLDHNINRITFVDMTPDPKGWQTWAEAHEVLDVTISFAMGHTSVVWSGKVPEKQRSYCTARSLVSWDKLLKAVIRHKLGVTGSGNMTIAEMNLGIAGLELTDSMREVCAGTIGGPEADAYFVTLQLCKEQPKYEDIVAHPTTARVPERADAQMLVTYNLAKLVSATDASSVVKYMDRMPKELAATFTKRVVERDNKLLSHPAFARWAMSNSELLTLINGIV